MNKFFASMIFFLTSFMLAAYPHFLLRLRNLVTKTDANVQTICFIHYHPELYLGIAAMAAAIVSFKYKKAQLISILISIVSLFHALTLNPVSYYTFGDKMMIAANTESIRSHAGIKYMLLVLALNMLILSLYAALIKQKPAAPQISIFLYAWANLKMRRFRTSALIAATATVTIVTLVSFFVFETVKKNITLSYQRLKADIVVVPQGKETEAFNFITKGQPSLFYFSEGVYEKLLKVHGIGEISPQLYLQPISYDIESTIEKVLVIAFDPASDFIVNPWVEYSIGRKNETSGLTVGYKIKYYPGQEIKLFGKKRRILSSLAPTGIGYLDHAVFIPLSEARVFISEFKKAPAVKTPKKRLPGMDFMVNTFNSEPDINQMNQDTFSAVFIKAENGISAKSLTQNIYDNVKGVSVIDINVTSKEEKKLLMAKIRPLIIPVLIIIAFGAIILFIAFSMIVNERRSEIGMLRAVGATRRNVFYGIIIEALLITAFGWCLGIIFGNAVFFAIKNSIMETIELLYIWPSPATMIFVFALTFAINIPLTLCAALYPALLASRIEPYAAIREGNS
ncbi:ABC transporter permease [Candidatus Magnetomonas plexicatena]|uniref:ABC transporter permease n=1 Tax=Candidatus Magnetomonas plexicatena TaxID=2552947 RepID=UPI001C77CFCC|nr:FtsX-like permease family protein [Nitrospirales bacterium LBB_01]